MTFRSRGGEEALTKSPSAACESCASAFCRVVGSTLRSKVSTAQKKSSHHSWRTRLTRGDSILEDLVDVHGGERMWPSRQRRERDAGQMRLFENRKCPPTPRKES